MMTPKIHIVRTADGMDFPLPAYTSKHHVGLNLMAAVSAPVKIGPRERVRVPTGFAVALPDGLCGQIVSNRDMALKNGIIVVDAPSIIHPADREPLFVLLRNESGEPFILRRGMQIAQMLLVPVVQTAWQEIETDLNTRPKNLTEVHVEHIEEESQANVQQDNPKRVKVSIRERTAK
ncbi:MAG: dUTP diphosphatase [Alphaproteobacteria bacterium]|nr:dUTP diphosphatase [Alphaproteobacteria bacterium]